MDVLYVFNFEAQHLKAAVQRLRYSLESIAQQGIKICVTNNSVACIYHDIKDIAPDLHYIHRRYSGPFSKAQAINFGVRNLVNSEYFMLSDIDLIYRPDHIQNVERKLESGNANGVPVRLIFYNYNLEPLYAPAWMGVHFLKRFTQKCVREQSADYWRLRTLPNNGGGFAHGNGIIHLPSFLRIRGYDEELIGYGPEDDLFNCRISKVNRIYYDADEATASIHLWHPRLRMIQYKKNMEIWRRKKAYYDNLQNPSWEGVTANLGKTNWGVFE